MSGKSIEHDIFGGTPRNKSINSKQKGNKNEVVIRKILSAWTGEEFQRTPSSGGLRWRNKSGIVGDVFCTNMEFDFPFTIETKHRKDIDLAKFSNPKGVIPKIWEQALVDGHRANRLPIAIIRPNGVKQDYWVVIMQEEVAGALPNIKYRNDTLKVVGFELGSFVKQEYKIFLESVKNSYFYKKYFTNGQTL